MKKILQFNFILFLLFTYNHVVGQNITIEVDPYQGRMTEENQTDDCLLQNNNNWYGNTCGGSAGRDPQNTECDDCFTGGSADIDVNSLWEAGGNWSGAHNFNDGQGCGFHNLGGTGSYTWVVAKTETLE